jgi:heme exporter protein D
VILRLVLGAVELALCTSFVTLAVAVVTQWWRLEGILRRLEADERRQQQERGSTG